MTKEERAVQLRWLATVPGYRESVRALVSAASKRREAKWSRLERNYWRRTF